jgi:thiaminase
MTAHALVQNAGPLWDEATHAPFLEALAAGTLPVEAFRRWLAQDYLFAKDLTAFQAISPMPHVTAIRPSSEVLGRSMRS